MVISSHPSVQHRKSAPQDRNGRQIDAGQVPTLEVSFAYGLVVITTYWPGHSEVKDNHAPEPNRPPTLVNTCVITNNVKRLVEFYEPILLLKAKWTGEDYVEFFTGQGLPAVFSAQDQEKYIPGSSIAAENKGVVLEFRLTDIDIAGFRAL